MKFVSDPPIAAKISKMKQRIRWQDPAIRERKIDQTRLVIADGKADQPEFSFLVVGDSGSGQHWGHNPQRQVAEQMVQHQDECSFVLHTGDVVYLVGSSEYYLQNFIEPYREFLVGGDRPDKIPYDRMLFKQPFLPIPGNHDYYDLPPLYGVLAQATLPVRQLLRLKLDFDVGWHGSSQGKAYAWAFLDCLQRLGDSQEVARHLDRHYVAQVNGSRCLQYVPEQFTRLPNRYYTFRYGGIDFFALDSNTFNAPIPIPKTAEGRAYRQLLEQRWQELEQERLAIVQRSATLKPEVPGEAEQLDDLRTKLEQIGEAKLDIEKQLAADQETVTDVEQLRWLQERLVESWQTPEVRGRVIYFHHPPYVTEATKWNQAQTVAVRDRLRQVLDRVASVVGAKVAERPLVDLILNGHAHCLEYLRTEETGHADSNLNWLICGGSGFSLRRQKPDGPDLRASGLSTPQRLIARSQLFIGRTGQGAQKRRPYSFLRIDVQAGEVPKFVIRPFVAERSQGTWKHYAVEPFVIQSQP